MPEGDTVYIAARRLDTALAGREITRFDLRVTPLALASAIGTTVREVVPVGKHLLMRFSDGRTLHSHLRMDGAWRVRASSERLPAREFEIRAIVGNDEWTATGSRVHDLRLIASSEESSLIGHLGPDLLADELDLLEALRRFAEHGDRPIGDALLDQRLVAGIGNVYKCELLFLHRISPWRPVREVADLAGLLNDAVRLLRANLGSMNRSTTGWNQPGQQYYVYGRRGRGCRRCGTRIVATEQGPPGTERVLYYCPSCQAS